MTPDRSAQQLPILMYHAVPGSVAELRTPIDIPREQFAAQLDALAADGWQVLGLTAALAAQDRDPAARVLALTIDDAYADAEGAAEELAVRGMSGTVYVPTAFPEQPGTTGGTFAHPLLSWDGLRALAAAGTELGSHALSHRPLDVLPSAVVRAELVSSREELLRRTGVTVTSLCYPYGYTSSRVRRLAAAAGYTSACTVGRRVATRADPRLALPRLQPMPGMSPADVVRLATHGEPGLVPVVKRYAQPAWRGVRFCALRLGVTLT